MVVSVSLPSCLKLYFDALDWDLAVSIIGENLNRDVELVDEECALHYFDL